MPEKIFLMQSIGKILLNPFFIGLPISILVILLLPRFFDKYKTELIDKKYFYHHASKVYYTDLNNDASSEFVYLHYSMYRSPNDSITDAPAVQIDTDCSAKDRSNIIDQYNLHKKWIEKQNLYFGDFDNDRNKEIYFYTYSKDSLFLNGLDAFNRNGIFLEKFICRFNYHNESPDILFGKSIINCDLNGDGYNEFLGSVIGAYSATPRFVFAYDIINDTLWQSKTPAINFSIRGILSRKSKDVLIYGANSAPGNVKDSILYWVDFTDHSSWLLVLDKNLDFVFPPIENPGFTSSVATLVRKEKGEIFIYALFKAGQNEKFNKLKKYNLEGIEIASKELLNSYHVGIYQKQEANKQVLYLRQGQTFYLIDGKLDFHGADEIKFRYFEFFDVDFDGSDEIFNWQEGEEFAYVYTSDFKHPSKVEIKDMFGGYILSPCSFQDNSANFTIHNGDFVYYFKYYENPYYYLQFPFYFAIFLTISFLFYIVMYFQRKALKNKFEQEKKVTQLELLTIKNQIDPHFIINAVNSLGAVIFKSDAERKQSYKFLINLTSLIRDTLQNSQKVTVSLKAELDFVENYLQLQKFRFRDSFEFEILNQIDSPGETEIPKMIIQTFAENAVKHGLAHKTNGKGKIVIEVLKNNGSIQITIQDNGIGRKKAEEVSTGSTGKGMEIIDQIIDLYNRLKKTNVSFEVIDLFDGGQPAGTRVVIKSPGEFGLEKKVKS